jgi:hypothetical protein
MLVISFRLVDVTSLVVDVTLTVDASSTGGLTLSEWKVNGGGLARTLSPSTSLAMLYTTRDYGSVHEENGVVLWQGTMP